MEDQIPEEKRAVGDLVTATIDGQVVTWTNRYDGGGVSTSVPAASAVVSSVSPAYSPPEPAPFVNASAGQWGRQAYYNAEQGVANGLVFLNNHGGEGSGVFD